MKRFDESPLRDLLDTAVPLWITMLEQLDEATFWVTWTRWRDTAVAEGVFMEHTLYGGRSEYSAQAFNALAKLIALLSFIPGGVHVFGRHWESKRK